MQCVHRVLLGVRGVVGKVHAGCAFHSGAPRLTVDKALLVKMRKATGYSFINCKKALEKFANDMAQAESWLHEQAQKEGWSKASKLKGRKTSEGLIGLLLGDKAAVMVEVNCETDFVARNITFQQLVKEAALAMMALHLQRRQSSRPCYTKSVLNGEDLGQLKSASDGAPLANKLALAIGKAGENLALKRAALLAVPPDFHIGSYVHGALPINDPSLDGTSFGKYAALVVCRSKEGRNAEQLVEVGRRLGQHVVGEAPSFLGCLDDLPCGETETRMMVQSFLPDPSRTVGQYVQEKAVRVLDFIRVECGESDHSVEQS
ncbi:LOW QUALITY PROTEIN: elongation factor Ts, mitochondrial [Erpetoichthys calabaricus]|uniref:LOW QUALITY PROTEIN: elongation factor Ts, mitochondrial n=1 Tax=Erpetoichthys calabaricus TaxID=27687 RepID=UPI002234BBA9|nr:LOW QUALITY PROTEIN: elongation factor Ts, mitochondrial [Erpetoichthys calabaricus]